MKIRIKGNSIRYRLTRSEVSKLALEGSLTEEVQFAPQKLRYILSATNETFLFAAYLNHDIIIYMPRQMIDELYSTERIGFQAEFEALAILIEKDFVCIDNTEEDQSDNYEHPETLKC